MSFDDTLAAVALYLESWERPAEPEGVTQAFEMLRHQARGLSNLTSKERERMFRDAAIREAARRGETYAEIGQCYGLSGSAVNQIALAAGIERRRRGDQA